MFLSGQEGYTERIEGQENDIVFEWISPEEQKQRAIDAIARHKSEKESAIPGKSLLTIDK